MSTGLIALLDDVAAIAKVAAASLDDVAAAASKAGAKAAGVVIDDAAVTPRYVVGLAAARELPIIRRIALGSLRNKIVILLPAALALSALAPWAITPLLMLGGAWLCYEGTEKVSGALFRHATESHAEVAGPAGGDPQSVEDAKVRAAISTDLILSAEIMAIALATLPDIALPMQAAILSAVAFGITVAVYGTVALIVKADDDAGVALAASGNRFVAALGRGLVRGMPPLLAGLSILGTAAMVWVGGGIIVHGLEAFGLGALGHAIDRADHAVGALVPAADGAISWAVAAAGAGVVGLAVGFALVPLVERIARPLARRLRARTR
jgi:predicted DNA repair protein MutK